MNNDEFIKKLSESLDIEDKDVTAEMVASLSEFISVSMQEAKTISLKDFGELEVNNEKEHIVVNPSTQQRILMPPALKILFNPAEPLISKLNVI